MSAGSLAHRFLLVLALAGPPAASRAEGPPVTAAVTGGFSLLEGSALASGPGAAGMVSIGIGRQIFLGVLGSASVHAASSGPSPVALAHLGGLAEWRLDTTFIVPLVSVSVGVLQASAPRAVSEYYPAFTVGLGLEWWPKAPLEGFSVGAEIRYLGLLPPEGLSPVVTTFALRLGWGF